MQHQTIIHIHLIKNIGPSILIKLIDQIGFNQIEQMYHYSITDFIAHGLSEQKAQKLFDGLKNQQLLSEELDLMRKHKVSVVTLWDQNYPALLKQIHVPPMVLYYQGDVNLFTHEKNIACVGARKAHRYTHEALKHLVAPMIADGWIVVSGGALGADTFAHQIALDHGGKTIVVVGSGFCFQYPSENKRLFERVVQSGGLIVSCFSMNSGPDAFRFPIRNRIISGLSKGCLVLQAASKSGALITAQDALEQGREVFAVPGSIFDPLSAGCHDLIQQGAKLVTSAQDILCEFDYGTIDVQKSKNVSINQEQIAFGDDVAQQILHIAVIPVTADVLLSKLGIDLDVLQNKLFELSLDGKIFQDAMGFWKRI